MKRILFLNDTISMANKITEKQNILSYPKDNLHKKELVMSLIFGFPAPYFRHIDVIQQVLVQLSLLPLEVIIVPVRSHPFDKKTNDPELILKLAHAFVQDVRDICNL